MCHQLIGDTRLIYSFKIGQLLFVVYAQDFIIVIGDVSLNGYVIRNTHGNNICQVIFTGSIIIAQLFQPLPQLSGRCSNISTVDFFYTLLVVSQVFMFNDSRYVISCVTAIAHNTAITGGIIQQCCHYRDAIRGHNGNVRLMLKLMGDFGRYYGDAGSKMRDFVTNHRPEEAERLAHNLHGVAGSFGAARLKDASKTLELALAEGETKNIIGLVQSFEVALTEVLESAEALASDEISLRESDYRQG